MKKGVITIAITILIIATMQLISPKGSELNPADLKTVKPGVKNIYDYINASGKIKEGDKRNIHINGIATVVDVLVKEGDLINQNDVIAKIKPISAQNTDWGSYYPVEEKVAAVFAEYGIEIDVDKRNLSAIDISKEDIITSPISGVVTYLNIEKGDYISAINRLVTVSDFSDLYVTAMIPEGYSSKIAVGQIADITAEAFGGLIYRGSVKSIEPTAKFIPSIMGDGKTYVVAEIGIDGTKGHLRPGLNVNTKIAIEKKLNAITLPYECILQDNDNREFVYSLDNQKIQKKIVEIGYELENEVEIISGVNKSDNIIINPPKELTGE